jgi:hypothetical protein
MGSKYVLQAATGKELKEPSRYFVNHCIQHGSNWERIESGYLGPEGAAAERPCSNWERIEREQVEVPLEPRVVRLQAATGKELKAASRAISAASLYILMQQLGKN